MNHPRARSVFIFISLCIMLIPLGSGLMTSNLVTVASARVPLTRLSDDEQLFHDSVREFASREVAPLVREMDNRAKIERPLIDKLFGLGVMGVEIPEEFGGAGASFFHAVLAVEALSRVDASVGV